MNKKKFLQTDSRWSQLGYPKSPCTIGNSGCGEVALVNCLIEMEKYAKYTPKTIQPYCKQYAASNCDGTYWSGIPKMMKHYGLEDVKEIDSMKPLWTELAKGYRVAIFLMGSRNAGSKGVHWTSSGHFVCSVAYKYDGNKHWLYVKDSYSDSKLRNGWISFEDNMEGAIIKIWTGKITGAVTSTVASAVKPSVTTAPGKLKVDGIGGKATVKAMQSFFRTVQDGVISGQNRAYSQLYPALQSVTYGSGGSDCIKALQKWLGLSDPDGIIGKNTTRAWQKKLIKLGYLGKNESVDGIIGVKTMKAWQECLNNDGKKKGGTPTPDPKPDKKQYKVIDVSEWQGKIDWKKVKADGVVGAIIRYADGDYLDPNFDTNMKNAKANGLHIGGYIFSRSKSKAGAEKEATRLFNACKKYKPDLPLYIDLEAKGLEKYADKVAQAFLNKIKALGGKGGVYANLNWWNNYLTETVKGSFAMWLAQYNDTMDYKPASYVGMWQYSSSGKVKGISGNVDMNRLYKAYWEEPTLTDKEIEACIEQAEWMKNYHYEWESKPTVPKSKKKGTCVTYVACVLQRIGVLKPGQYIWHNGKGYGTGKVYGTNDKMTTTYMDNKTFTACKDKLKKGDIVLVDDNKSGVSGNGGHIMIFAGKWSADGEPYIYDNVSAERVKDGKKPIRTYGKNRKILAIVRLKK